MNKLSDSREIQVSVVVPMKNAEKYISKTLNNILQQTNVEFEVIVVNDQSSDASADIVNSFNNPKIKLLEGLGLGISEALNLGYRSANGAVIVRCDADDYICPDDRLYKQVEFLNTNPTYQAVCGNFYGMDQHDNHLGSFSCGETQSDITDTIKSGITKSHWGSYAIRKELFEKLEGFRPYFVTAEDVDFQLRIVEHARVMYFPDHWYIYRLHADSITHTQKEHTRLKYEATARRFQTQRLNVGSDDLQLGKANLIDEHEDTSHASSAKDHAINLVIANSWQLHDGDQKIKAFTLLFQVYKKNPTSLSLLKHLILLLLK